MLKRYAIQDGSLLENGPNPSVFIYMSPDETERRELVHMGFDDHNIISALDPDEPARLEVEPDHLALIFKRPKTYSAEDKFLFKVSSMGLFLKKDVLIIVLGEDVPLFAGKGWTRVESLEEVFLRALSATILHYLQHLRVIHQIGDELEEKINASMENRHLLSLFSLEKSLVYYLSAVDSNRFALEKLKTAMTRADSPERSLEFLDDILIENAQCQHQAEIYSNILASVMDARVSIVNNNISILMKRLNLVTISIMVPTLVVSIFSMNVRLPIGDHPQAFWFVLALSFTSAFAVMIFWRMISRHNARR